MYESIVYTLTESVYLVIPLALGFLYFRKGWKYALCALIAVVSTLVAIMAIKVLVFEPRPCFLNAMACDDPLQSFPSRHAAIVAAPVAFLLFNKRIAAAYLGYLALICWSRVYLMEHYPHDVVAGALIGLTIGTLWLELGPSECKKNRRKNRD